MTWIYRLILEIWEILLDASPYIFLGLVVAGLIRAFVTDDLVRRHLGRGKAVSVIKAAIFGVPLPLCSCGVLPVARELHRQGATKGATTAFLISTPESGVDSISVTWALMDPMMTLVRPLAAMTTAIVAGLSSNVIDHDKALPEEQSPDQLSGKTCGCGKSCQSSLSCDHNNPLPKRKRIAQGITYAFTELWRDIGTWFFVGILLSALIGVLVPEDLLETFFGGGMTSMLLMLLVGIPIYICATASTPIAAALILKGVSPGAALVFLLAGPATNMASLSVLLKILGKKSVAVYLTSISVMAVFFGLVVDALYARMGISPTAILGTAGEVLPPALRIGSAIMLILLTLLPLLEKQNPAHQH